MVSSRTEGHRSERSGEPLAASWHPTAEHAGEADDESPKPSRRRRALGRYGWRIYALPLLVVVSALAVFQAVRPPEGGRALEMNPPNDDTGPAAPIVTEAPPGQTFAPDMFSADLPPGAPLPEFGARTFDVLPGTSPRVGQGDLYRYTVEVEVGVKLSEGNDSFGHLVQETLSDPRSWTNPQAGGIALERVDRTGPRPDFRVILVSQQTAREACDFSNGVPFDSSCRKGDMVYINAARWVRGAVSFEGDSGSYRRYAINHEVGHVFGNGHVGCPAPGGLAPVMMQQTFSVANNELHELNKVADQGTFIPANGFVCKYNAWPFPVGGNGGP
ncbi:DUF3152 domain-containing protein [Saccharopolyspora erythraea]|uniref:DUF3152 domain-containing protein n=1 Tax=Saccharopolyspora erythraea TaxID=1836 RepID=UPI001BACF02D|nr:DUF3152 domain-containing protein [Saccharopolyspora erythraea]QUH00321.1 DUF3152 domain-containing protein [Saccharopolyspora erythraea]